MESFFSHGKLLISAEYLVLDGALSLAIPTSMGQTLEVNSIEDTKNTIYWQSTIQKQNWFTAKIDYSNWEILDTNITNIAKFIVKVLQEIQRRSKIKFQYDESYAISADIGFPRNYGLGSSSTLLYNLAQWAEIDAFELNEATLGGSGYDIAVAQQSVPILYQINNNKRRITPVDFNPDFKDEIIFVHLNQKQNSRDGIKLYKSKQKSEKLISEITNITNEIVKTKDIKVFSELLTYHEKELSKYLGLQTVKQRLFSDIPVFVKSLGAWGGDFIMTQRFDGYEKYFSDKGMKAVINWNKMIL